MARLYEDDDSMYVIRHDHAGVQSAIREVRWDVVPALPGNAADWRQHHFALGDIAQEQFAPPGANRDEIEPRRGVIPMFQPGCFDAVFVPE